MSSKKDKYKDMFYKYCIDLTKLNTKTRSTSTQIDIETMSNDEFNDYVLNFEIYEINNNLLYAMTEGYKQDYYNVIDPVTNYNIFNANGLKSFLAIFFIGSMYYDNYDEFAKHVNIYYDKIAEPDLIDEMCGCCGLKHDNVKSPYNIAKITKIIIGDVNLLTLKDGVIYNTIEQDYKVSLSKLIIPVNSD